VDLLLDCWLNDAAIYLLGNGGSAATANHHVIDLVNASGSQRRHLRAHSLSSNVGLVMATANDVSFADVFTRQLAAFGRPGDVVVALSCSGTSPNVVAAGRWAKANDLRLVCMTGNPSGGVGDLADIHMCVPSTLVGVVEDLHLAIGHMASQAFRHRIGCA
jgi:D-sedoheptulose 7-phosphate isomerase